MVDDNFQIEEMSACRQYKSDPDGEYANDVYYVGPYCTTDCTGVRMALFNDENCDSLEEAVTFEDTSAGSVLPFADGGLVSPSCESCSSVNDENDIGDAGVKDEMCWGLYDQA